MGIEVNCDDCGKSTDDVLCQSCAARSGVAIGLDEDALHDLAIAIARQRSPDEAFMALDVLIRDFANADKLRERIAIARAAA